MIKKTKKEKEFVMAPANASYDDLMNSQLYSKESPRQYKKGGVVDVTAIHLSLKCQSPNIIYSVFEDENGEKIFKPANILQGIARYLANL